MPEDAKIAEVDQQLEEEVARMEEKVIESCSRTNPLGTHVELPSHRCVRRYQVTGQSMQRYDYHHYPPRVLLLPPLQCGICPNPRSRGFFVRRMLHSLSCFPIYVSSNVPKGSNRFATAINASNAKSK